MATKKVVQVIPVKKIPVKSIPKPKKPKPPVVKDEMKKVVKGEMFIQDNQERKFGSDPQYLVLWAVLPDAVDPTAFLFTREQLTEAVVRAEKNPEDIIELGSIAPINSFDSE